MSWPISALGEHCDILSGYAFKSSQFNTEGEGLPLIRIRDVVPGKSETYYSGEYENRFLVTEGDLLIGMDGDFNRARWQSEPALLNQRVCKVSAKGNLDQGYLYHLLPSVLQTVSDRTPFVTVKHLSAKDLRDFEVPLPPLEEQKRIAGILDQADALRRLRARALEKLNTLGQVVFQEMFGKGTTYPTKMIKDFAAVKGGKRLPKGADYSDAPTSHPYIRVSDLNSHYIDTSSMKFITDDIHDAVKRYIVNEGDVIISIAGSIGITASVPEVLSGANLTENAAKITPIEGVRFNSTYIDWALSSQQSQQQISSNTGQVTIGKLALFRIETIEIPFPPLSVQSEFECKIKEINSMIDNEKNAVKSSEQLFSSLQSAAFQGKL